MIVRKDKCITILEGDKLRNEIDNGSVALWDVPSTSGVEPGCWLWLATKVVIELTASLEAVLDIDEEHLSSKDDKGLWMLSFAAKSKGKFWLFLMLEAL